MGNLAPILFVGMVIILGLFETGYNQKTMMRVLGGVQGWRGAIFSVVVVYLGIKLFQRQHSIQLMKQ